MPTPLHAVGKAALAILVRKIPVQPLRDLERTQPSFPLGPHSFLLPI